MNTLVSGLWACALLITTCALPPEQPSPAEIRLELVPENSASGVPTSFAFVLTNLSNGDMSVPPPDVDCGNRTPRGTILLEESWMPASGDGLAKGSRVCDFVGFSSRQKLTLAELTKTWKVLHTGESLRVVADSVELHYDASSSGTYTFSARYSPPQLSPEAELLVSQTGIKVPRQVVKTPAQQYTNH